MVDATDKLKLPETRPCERAMIACVSIAPTWLSCTAAGSERCPPLQSTDRVQGIEAVHEACVRAARQGDAAASWTLAVMSRYMTCDATTESRRIAQAWQDEAYNAGNPDALFESAMLEFYALGTSIDEHEIESTRRIVRKLHQAALLRQRDANFQLYHLHQTFRHATPPIAELGTHADAVGHLLRAVDLGSHAGADVLAGAYLWAKDAHGAARPAGRDGLLQESSNSLLIDELDRRGMLPGSMASAAELNLITAASSGRWEAMERLEDGYVHGTFGTADPVRAAAWAIVRRLDGDSRAQIPRVEPAVSARLCDLLQDMTNRGRIFEYHRPDWNALASSHLVIKHCVHAPAVPAGPSCLRADQLVEP